MSSLHAVGGADARGRDVDGFLPDGEPLDPPLGDVHDEMYLWLAARAAANAGRVKLACALQELKKKGTFASPRLRCGLHRPPTNIARERSAPCC